jgi:hypothetical protein
MSGERHDDYRLRLFASLVPLLPYLPAFGTFLGIRASFDALDGGRTIPEAMCAGFWYSGLGAAISLLIGLILALVCRPWRSS